jgi:cation diffusion facilitator family transporter
MVKYDYTKVKVVIWVIMLANFAVCAVKIVLGLLINSSSLTADGFHSLSDGSSNIVGLIGIAMASRPEDKDHPYGHSKFETMAGLLIAGVLVVMGIEIVSGAIGRFSNPVRPEVSIVSLIALVATLGINIVVTTLEHRQGVKLNSNFLISDAIHTKSDIYVSIGVLVTLVAMKLGLPPIIDPIASLVVAGFIFFAAWEIFSRTSGVLLDKAAIDNDRIVEIAKEFEQVKGVHKVRSRSAGSEVFIELHVQMDPKLSVEDSHQCIHQIIGKIQEHLGQPAHVIIHTEPYYEHKAVNSEPAVRK